MAYFFVARSIFLIYNYEKTIAVSSGGQVMDIFLHGLKMDASVTGYFLILPVVYFILSSFFKGNKFEPVIKYYTFFILFITTILMATDLRIYHHWGYRLDVSPFLYLKNPEEAVNFISFAELAVGIPAILIMTGLCYYAFDKILKPASVSHKRSWMVTPLTFITLGILLIIPIRGGVGLSPLNESSVYFSTNNYCNQGATNVFWNVAHSITELDKQQQSYKHMPDGLAQSIVDDLYRPAKKTKKILKKKRPNIVLVVMESMTKKMLYSEKDSIVITPHLNQYGKEGIYFSNFYGSGERTDKGLVAILSGYPPIPASSITNSPKKVDQLPSLLKTLKTVGYHTSFYYGGDINFANIKSYIIHCGPDVMVDKTSFPSKYYDAKWGVHDHLLFEKVYEDMQSDTSPWIKTILTLSNHEPFDVPQPMIFDGDDPERLFANAANFADNALFEFIECLRETPDWKNTLVILVADHSTVLPFYSSHYELARFEIPMIWLGGALKSGKQEISKFGDQTDISYTLLKQLNVTNEEYHFGKDLFARDAPSFAYYVFNKGFGFVSDSITLIYDNKNKEYLVHDLFSDDFPEGVGKAHQQVISRDFNEK